jgi:threonine 3-dehydrogenase
MEKTMKAVVKTHDMGVGAELRKVPIPSVGPGEVLVKVEKVAICGSDKHRYNWEPTMGSPTFYRRLSSGTKSPGK